MRFIDIQKKPSGYVLRHSSTIKFLTFIPCALIAIPATILPIPLFFIEGGEPGNLVPTILGMVIMWAISAYVYSLAFGYRIVVDETGAHRYSFRRVKHTLLWRHIRSFGIGETLVTYRHGTTNHLAFYASTEAKPINMENKVFIKLSKSDEQAPRESGLLTFCRRQMAEAERDSL